MMLVNDLLSLYYTFTTMYRLVYAMNTFLTHFSIHCYQQKYVIIREIPPMIVLIIINQRSTTHL